MSASILLPDLAAAVERDGVAAHHRHLRQVALDARRAGLSPVLADVLADADAPEVARLRAFGRLAAQLAGSVPPRLPGHGAEPARSAA